MTFDMSHCHSVKAFKSRYAQCYIFKLHHILNHSLFVLFSQLFSGVECCVHFIIFKQSNKKEWLLLHTNCHCFAVQSAAFGKICLHFSLLSFVFLMWINWCKLGTKLHNFLYRTALCDKYFLNGYKIYWTCKIYMVIVK